MLVLAGRLVRVYSDWKQSFQIVFERKIHRYDNSIVASEAITLIRERSYFWRKKNPFSKKNRLFETSHELYSFPSVILSDEIENCPGETTLPPTSNQNKTNVWLELKNERDVKNLWKNRCHSSSKESSRKAKLFCYFLN